MNLAYLGRRLNDGATMATEDRITLLEDGSFIVVGETGVYFVDANGCTCGDYANKGKYLNCKHINAVSYYLSEVYS